jgi:hypothetical protein
MKTTTKGHLYENVQTNWQSNANVPMQIHNLCLMNLPLKAKGCLVLNCMINYKITSDVR